MADKEIRARVKEIEKSTRPIPVYGMEYPKEYLQNKSTPELLKVIRNRVRPKPVYGMEWPDD